ncbi:MAG: hypothetical protein PHV33_00560 [Elusimicrobiales bacterium]|nr:hypothetical protein [Elusimicrobiales bacterium]
MRKFPALLLLCALPLAGCGKGKAELAAEQAAAAEAQAAAQDAAKKAAGPTDVERKQAAATFIALVCSQPRLLEEAETSLDLLEAFSGEGADQAEARNHFSKAQAYYSGLLQQELPARGGASYEALLQYGAGVLPRQAMPGRPEEFRRLIKLNCPGVDAAQAEKVTIGILAYCISPAS